MRGSAELVLLSCFSRDMLTIFIVGSEGCLVVERERRRGDVAMWRCGDAKPAS